MEIEVEVEVEAGAGVVVLGEQVVMVEMEE